jgi:hypothetical protein
MAAFGPGCKSVAEHCFLSNLKAIEFLAELLCRVSSIRLYLCSFPPLLSLNIMKIKMQYLVVTRDYLPDKK